MAFSHCSALLLHWWVPLTLDLDFGWSSVAWKEFHSECDWVKVSSVERWFSSPAPTPHSHPITSCIMMWALFFSSVFYALDSWQSISHTLRLPSVGTLRKRSRCCSRLSPRPPLCISDLNIKPVLDVSWSTSNFSGKNATLSLFKISFLRLWMGWYTAHHPFCHPLTGLFPQRYSAYVAERSHCGTLTL